MNEEQLNVNQLWNSFLEKINTKVSKISYDTWFANSKLIEIKDNIAIVLVEIPMQKKQFEKIYNDLIEEVFNEVAGSDLNMF